MRGRTNNFSQSRLRQYHGLCVLNFINATMHCLVGQIVVPWDNSTALNAISTKSDEQVQTLFIYLTLVIVPCRKILIIPLNYPIAAVLFLRKQ